MTAYVLSRPAQLDFLEIVTYLERQSPKAALRVEQQLIEAMDALATLPVRFQLRPQLVPAPFRVCASGNYLIIYNPDASPMSVARILHGKRNVAGILRGLEADE